MSSLGVISYGPFHPLSNCSEREPSSVDADPQIKLLLSKSFQGVVPPFDVAYKSIPKTFLKTSFITNATTLLGQLFAVSLASLLA